MLFVVVLIGSMAVLSLSLVVSVSSSNGERKGSQRSINSIYVCEAALSESIMDLSAGGDGNLGGEQNQLAYGDASYYVSADDQGNGIIALTATGSENSDLTRIETLVRRVNNSFWQWGAFGDEGMTMDSNARVDSYDSTLGLYEDQDTNGSGANKYALTNGDVGSNGDVTLLQNTTIWGDANPGPSGTTTAPAGAISGSTAQAPSLLSMPALVFPTPVTLGSWNANGTNTLASGTYAYDTLNVDGDLTVVGPATLVVTDLELTSNSSIIIDATAGEVELWVAEDFIMNSNSTIGSTTKDPADLQVYLNSDNVLDPNTNITVATVTLNSNTELYGTIYAPNARIEIDSNFQLYGAIVARHVQLDSNSRIHFDENLKTGESVLGGFSYETLCWRIIANP